MSYVVWVDGQSHASRGTGAMAALSRLARRMVSWLLTVWSDTGFDSEIFRSILFY